MSFSSPLREKFSLNDLYTLVLVNRRLSDLLVSLLAESVVKKERCTFAALFWAAATGREAMVGRVLENGPRIVIEDIVSCGETLFTVYPYDTVLYRGSAKCSDEVVKQVLKKGANLIIKEQSRRLTGLHWTYENRHRALFKLLQQGANINTKVTEICRTILHLAAWDGDEVSARLLLSEKQCLDVRSMDDDGCTPLHLAVKAGHLKLVEPLLDNNAVMGYRLNLSDTALHLAAKHDHEAVVALLLKRGADPNSQDICEMTTLHLAALYQFQSVAELLLLNGVDFSIRDRHGATALHVAAENGDIVLTKLLLERGADIE